MSRPGSAAARTAAPVSASRPSHREPRACSGSSSSRRPVDARTAHQATRSPARQTRRTTAWPACGRIRTRSARSPASRRPRSSSRDHAGGAVGDHARPRRQRRCRSLAAASQAASTMRGRHVVAGQHIHRAGAHQVGRGETLPEWLPPRTMFGAPAITSTPSRFAACAASIATGNSLMRMPSAAFRATSSASSSSWLASGRSRWRDAVAAASGAAARAAGRAAPAARRCACPPRSGVICICLHRAWRGSARCRGTGRRRASGPSG